MAKWRSETVPGTPYGDSNVSLGRSVYFGNLWLSIGDGQPVVVGGMQAFSVEENNNTSFRAMAGSDWLEPVFGMREWSGQGSRFQIRGSDLQEIMFGKYNNTDKSNPNAINSGLMNIDWRFLPFTWQFTYNFTSVDNNTTFENLQWAWCTVIITRYRWNFTSPTELISEDFSFIAKGFTRAENGGSKAMQNQNHLWGNGTYLTDPPIQTTASTAASAQGVGGSRGRS